MGLSWENVCPVIGCIIIMAMCTFGESVASVHKVGGSAGWTILGNVDYKKWTSSDIFIAGDSLLFVYNTQFHNVKQVSRRDFLSCNATSAVATYNSGSDTVALTRPGHYYFLCGFPGHCQAGQKLHVLVVPTAASPSLSPDISPVPSPSTGSSPSPATASEDSAQNSVISLSVSMSTAIVRSQLALSKDRKSFRVCKLGILKEGFKNTVRFGNLGFMSRCFPRWKPVRNDCKVAGES